MKVFVVDVDRCNGCYNCQIACKDEHCGQAWPPYTDEQPEIGQFWCRVEDRVRGQVPWTRISYIPHFDAQTEAIREYAPEALIERDDGIIAIDPVKSKGRKDLAEKFDGVYWNEKLQIPQGCAGCAHLLDAGWEVPRCVDACATDALRFGEEEDLKEYIAEAEQLDDKSHVYYLNYPKRFVAATVFDPSNEEVIIGARIELMWEGNAVSELRTDEMGDFKFNQVDPHAYKIRISADGYQQKVIDADLTQIDRSLGDIELIKMADRVVQ